jgi:hypothetical protein
VTTANATLHHRVNLASRLVLTALHLTLAFGCSRPQQPARPVTATNQPTKSTDASPCGRPFPAGGAHKPPQRQKLKVAARFDENHDGRLEFSEREAARAYIAAERSQAPAFPPHPRQQGVAPPWRGPFADLAAPTPGPRLLPGDVAQVSIDADLYEPTALRTFWVTFDRDDWEKELADFYDSDVQLPAKLATTGVELTDVGVQFRGMSSYMMVPAGYKRSLSISIGSLRPQQQLFGHRNLNWLNGAHDPSLLRSVLALTIMRDYVPAPNANHVRVVINGESWGIYVNTQPFDVEFASERFGESGGRRWKVPGSPNGRGSLEYLGDDPSAYKAIYDLKSPKEDTAYRDLIRLCKTLSHSDAATLERELGSILDVDEVIRYIALDNLLVHSDSYLARASDYGLYQGKDGKFRFIPHDVDETFHAYEACPGGKHVGAALDPLAGADNPQRPLISKLLAVPAWRAKYLAALHEMTVKWLDWERLSPIVAAHAQRIRADVERDTRKLTTVREFEASLTEGFERPGPCGNEQVFGLKSFVEQRRAYLLKHPAFQASPATR